MMAVAALMAACTGKGGNPNTTTAAAAKPAPPPTSDLSAASQAAYLDMLKPYYELKEALVAASAAKADAAAARLMAAAEATRLAITSNDGRDTKASVYLAVDSMTAVLKNTEALINLKDDTTCAKKRAFFEKISDEIFAVGQSVHFKNAGVYRDFCPMAFNDKGAYWLSDSAEIRNPYFGHKMLECGEVRDSL